MHYINQTKKNMMNLDLNQVRWYVRYRIGWVVVWCRISFRCHDFFWWFMQWWSRVTCYTISKYWWSGYQKKCMYQMYRRWQYLFYFTNIQWIMDWSNIFQIWWNGLIWVGVIQINANWFWIFLIPNYRIFAPNVFNFKIIFALSIFDFVSSRFSPSLFAAPCHAKPL